MIVADLDHFKRVNDTHGHSVGDAVLRDVAYLLRKQLRAFDLAYRLGGEEFLILVPGSDVAHTAELAERLRVAVGAEPVGGGVHVTMSIGVAASEHDHRFDYGSVFGDADKALYAAKRAGRNQVCLSDDASRGRSHRRSRSRARLSATARSRCGCRPGPPSARTRG